MKYDMFFLAALLAIAGLRAIVLSFFSNAAESTATITRTIKPIELETTFTKKVLSQGRTSLNGTVEAVETVTTTSHFIGQIQTLPVQEGDTVKAGQIIAIIDVKNIQAQRNEVSAAISQAQASLTVATAAQIQALANKTQAQAQLNHATARYQEAEIKLQEAQAQLGEALLNQQRMAMLHKDVSVSQLQLYTANTQLALIEARIQQAKAAVKQALCKIFSTMNRVSRSVTPRLPVYKCRHERIGETGSVSSDR